ncbi:MAG: hypothetical protein M9916_04655 [Crocinitomicaceae bacterium]|nr:hypothetical protein [Crocinitomicaceae bacterium]
MKFFYTTITTLYLVCSNVFSQEINKFKVISEGNNISIKNYEIALESADLEAYRYRSEIDTLSFDNGVKFILYSAEDLLSKGLSIDLNNYKNPIEIDKEYIKPIFKLTPEGWLIALYERAEKN